MQTEFGIQFEYSDWKRIEGAKHRVRREKNPDIGGKDVTIPGLERVFDAFEFCGLITDIERLEKSKDGSHLTLTLKQPLQLYQRDEDGRRQTRRRAELKFSSTFKRASRANSFLDPLFREFVELAPKKIRIQFSDADPDCSFLKSLAEHVKKCRLLRADAEKREKQLALVARKNAHKSVDEVLGTSKSWARRAVDRWSLDTSRVDRSVSEEDWKQYFMQREQHEKDLLVRREAAKEYSRRKGWGAPSSGMVVDLTDAIRKDLVQALRTGQVPKQKALAIANGLFVHKIKVDEEYGDTIVDVDITVKMFAHAANAQRIDIELSRTDAWKGSLKAHLHAAGRLDKVGTTVRLYFFGFCERTDRERSSLFDGVEKCTAALLGDSGALSKRKAFAAFVRAGGVTAEPANVRQWGYEGSGPLTEYRLRHNLEDGDLPSDADCSDCETAKNTAAKPTKRGARAVGTGTVAPKGSQRPANPVAQVPKRPRKS